MGLEVSLGLGLYISGLVLFARTLEEHLPLARRGIFRWLIVATFAVVGVLLIVWN